MNIELQETMDNAIRNYISNKKSGSPAESLAYDEGVIQGIKIAMEIVENETTLERDIREENERQRDSGDPIE